MSKAEVVGLLIVIGFALLVILAGTVAKVVDLWWDGSYQPCVMCGSRRTRMSERTESRDSSTPPMAHSTCSLDCSERGNKESFSYESSEAN